MALEDKLRWKDLGRQEQKKRGPLDFLRERYKGLTRGKLAKEDSSLYLRLWKNGLLGDVPVQQVQQEQRDFGSDPVAYYREHYQSLTRGELKKKDSGLYNRLWRDGLLEQVPTASRFGSDPVAYYREHYSGFTRGELQREDCGLYKRLWRDGLLEHVPLKRR